MINGGEVNATPAGARIEMTKTALTAACVVLMPFALALTGFTSGSPWNQAPPAPAAAPAAVPPPPGLHRLNRTEYANTIRDVLDLEIDAAALLPSDDSTHGFDNIAGALGLSSTLVEAYVAAAGKISRLAIGEPAPAGLVVYRTPEDTSQDYHIEGLPFGTRGGLLVKHVFPSDGEYAVTVTPIFGDNMSPTGFGSVPCEKLEILLDGARVQLLDWQGSRGFGAPEATCSGPCSALRAGSSTRAPSGPRAASR